MFLSARTTAISRDAQTSARSSRGSQPSTARFSSQRPAPGRRPASSRIPATGAARLPQEFGVDQVEDLPVVEHVELAGEELRRRPERGQVARLQQRRPRAARPVDVAEVVVDDRIGEFRVHEDGLEEDLVWDVDVPKEVDDLRATLHEPGHVLDAGAREVPVRPAPVGRGTRGEATLPRQANVRPAPPPVPVLDSVEPAPRAPRFAWQRLVRHERGAAMLGEEALDLGRRLDRIVLARQEHEVLEIAPAREERVDSLERRANVAEAAPVARVALEQAYARPACESALEPFVLRVVRLLVDMDVDD